MLMPNRIWYTFTTSTFYIGSKKSGTSRWEIWLFWDVTAETKSDQDLQFEL